MEPSDNYRRTTIYCSETNVPPVDYIENMTCLYEIIPISNSFILRVLLKLMLITKPLNVKTCRNRVSVQVKNRDIYQISKRFTGGSNIPKLLFKGISGSFTMSTDLFEKIIQKKGILALHLLDFISKMPSDKTVVTEQFMYDTIVPRFLTFNKILRENHLVPYGEILPNKPYGLLYPWVQNFIAHSTYNKVFDSTKITFTKNPEFKIISDTYKNKGMTLQNLIESELIIKAVTPIYQEFTKTNNPENMQLHLINNGMAKKSYKTANTQASPDAIAQIHYVQNSIEQPPINLEIPFDAKIIRYPENNINPLGGNISITHNIDIILFMNRLKGILSQKAIEYNNQRYIPEIIMYIDQHIKDYKKDLNQKYKSLEKSYIKKEVTYEHLELLKIEEKQKIDLEMLNKFYALVIKILLEPNSKIYPSIILSAQETTKIDILNFSKEELIIFLESMDKTSLANLHPTYFFPRMGHENADQFKKYLEEFIHKKTPNSFRPQLENNYNTFFDILNSITKKTIMDHENTF